MDNPIRLPCLLEKVVSVSSFHPPSPFTTGGWVINLSNLRNSHQSKAKIVLTVLTSISQKTDRSTRPSSCDDGDAHFYTVLNPPLGPLYSRPLLPPLPHTTPSIGLQQPQELIIIYRSTRAINTTSIFHHCYYNPTGHTPPLRLPTTVSLLAEYSSSSSSLP